MADHCDRFFNIMMESMDVSEEELVSVEHHAKMNVLILKNLCTL